MRRLHFDALKPICPTCRRGALVLEPGAQATSNAVMSGVLRCLDPDCGERFPIIAGVPILVPDVRGWLSANLPLVLAGDVEDAAVEAVISAAVGPDSAYAISRAQQSRYAHDHYGDLFEGETDGAEPPPGRARHCLAEALKHFGVGRGPRLDIGCAAGRTSFDLAAHHDVPVLGVDLNWPLLRIGRGILDRGLLRYPLRHCGDAYERRETYHFPPEADRVDFWIADAQALPFAANTFRLVVALNVIDRVPDPARLVAEVSRVTRPGGDIAFATPLDPTPQAALPFASLEGPDALAAMIATANRDTAGAKPLRPTGPPRNYSWSAGSQGAGTIVDRSRLITMKTAAD
ncbi:methyltransferase domain-containing protein [Methylobacterium sp. E-005]|uniref:class I SAM-dependent methyltransferase n=1 Tax=Methylobacterium sp. E-005 TaxID=2836549 RepID=UPI001FB93879|nr:class I SAM-dependent methyltransferase [Methylobacterium sp. E-005]MCJ2085440.1 methyltransferase domain-containing protein [Methylobacterium sp. E-005]